VLVKLSLNWTLFLHYLFQPFILVLYKIATINLVLLNSLFNSFLSVIYMRNILECGLVLGLLFNLAFSNLTSLYLRSHYSLTLVNVLWTYHFSFLGALISHVIVGWVDSH
jgi:hypothetical protein